MKVGFEQTPSTKKPKYKKSTDLLFNSHNGRPLAAVEHIWPGSIQLLARRSRLYDKVLALAELPSPEDLPRILQVSQREKIPSLWMRARPSRLETNATALICALVFCSRGHWIGLVGEFLKAQNLTEQLRGRPKVQQKESVDFLRGVQIDQIKERLEAGFQTKNEAKRKGGFASGDQQIDAALKLNGYNDKERTSLRQARTLQAAALEYYFRTTGSPQNVTRSAIQNSYSRYTHALRTTSSRPVS
jgi:hypothetical protein